ncbi:tubby protein homolog [Pseudophryne corroboree]|uniref:tubby protein homolog n=1 Tax=Pseudophryne corroboree TaxID=495146 RepID=UPI00308165DE
MVYLKDSGCRDPGNRNTDNGIPTAARAPNTVSRKDQDPDDRVTTARIPKQHSRRAFQLQGGGGVGDSLFLLSGSGAEDDVCNVRQQRLELQRKLFEKKQRRKRQEPQMIQPNVDYKVKPRRSRKTGEQEAPGESSTGSSIFMGVSVDATALTEGTPASRCLSPIIRKVNADCKLEKKEELNEANISDEELEETLLEDVLPRANKKEPNSANQEQETKTKDGDAVPGTVQNTNSEKAFAFDNSSEEEAYSVSVGDRKVPPAPVKQRKKKKTQKQADAYEEDNDYEDILSSVAYARPMTIYNKEEDSMIAVPLEIDDLKEFALCPAPHNMTLKCRITRDKRGIEKGIYPTYYLHLERDDGQRMFLMAGKKRKKSKASNYLLSVDPTDLSRGGESYIGKVRSNMLGTRFTVFDNGVSPESKPFVQERETIRQELASISYKTNVLGLRGPRKMKVIIPGMNQERERVCIQPLDERETLLSRYQNGNMEDIIYLQNKVPSWNEETQSHVLNFHGRVTLASVKNFQIINAGDPENILLQFGRVADDVFTMDCKYPLSPIQAFGICLSSFDGKLACE